MTKLKKEKEEMKKERDKLNQEIINKKKKQKKISEDFTENSILDHLKKRFGLVMKISKMNILILKMLLLI